MNKFKNTSDAAVESYQNLLAPSGMGPKKNFHASLDSLANSLNTSESLSDDSHDSDSSGTDNKSKSSFAVKCDVYAQNGCGSIRSWSKSDTNSEHSYEYVTTECANAEKQRTAGEKRIDMVMARMETIPEENSEPKISVKEILARFENLKDKKEKKVKKDKKGKEGKKCAEEKEVENEV